MGKKSSKTTTKTEMPKWAQGYAKQAAGQISGVVNANQGNLDQMSGQIRGYLPQLGEMAFGEQPGVKAGMGYLTDVLGGKYLNSNPYIDSMATIAEQRAGNTLNSTFSGAGRTGGGNHATNLARGVADANNSLRFGAYNQERQNQNAAAGLMPGMTQAQFAGVAPYLAAAQTAGQLPYAGIQHLPGMGSLWAGQGTTTQTQSGGGGLLGGLLGAASNMFSFAPISLSARETKTDIVELGEWDDAGDGLKRYAYRYKTDPEGTRREGVMADEVERLRPWAYVPNVLGDKPGVNYALLGGR